jgi:uncharacterized membrane protein YsdA (DUF1294 family)/cold shock CspA family protein
MRHWGKISKWDDERGFGFISSRKGGDTVFFHISSFQRRDRRPSVNDPVSYTLRLDSQGRSQANDIQFVGASDDPAVPQFARTGIALPIAFAICFLIFVAALAAVGWLGIGWLALYYGASLFTYFCYWRDKTAALTARRRTRESTLHLMSLIGGWPGALIAQALLRHKTRKTSFLVEYWITVIINCIALGVIVGKGPAPLKALLDR